jgi:type II secretory pathway predicted ATPase ExeA
MYLDHYGLTEAPFRITPHTDFFFAGANRGTTLEALLYAITHDEGIVKISGEVGSGKTMLCRVLMERLPENVAIIYLANPSLSREDILYALADELGIAMPEHSRTNTVMRALQEHLVELYAAGKQVVVLIDEAHAMPVETLEEIRLLSNLESNRHKLLQLVLFGQPEINETLARSDMRQLRDRITHNFNLEPLVRDDIEQYLDFRMRAAGYHGPSVFAPEAVKSIAKASQGLTRRINILADKALLASYAAGVHLVGDREVKAAIKDSEFASAGSPASGRGAGTPLIWAAAGAVAVLAVLGLLRLATLPVSEPSAPPAPAPMTVPAEKPAAAPAAATVPPAAPAAVPSPAEKQLNLLDEKLSDGHAWRDAVEDNRWVLQLYTVNDSHRAQIEKFLVNIRQQGVDMEQVRVYRSEAGDTGRYGVIYGDYASRKSAQQALIDLHPVLKPYGPYLRKTSSLK